jgi:hypothetical protein
MIDVFIRVYPQSDIRRYMAKLVGVRLEAMRGIEVGVMLHGAIPEPYHITSKKLAEETAKSPIYCVIDDDQLPIRDDFFSYGAAVLETHPDYGMLAGFPLEYERVGEPYADNRNIVVEAHSIGCPYWVRKGTLKHFPDSPLHKYDGDLSKVVTDQGLKTGLIRHAVYNHLGFGFSQVQHAT